MRVFSFFDFKFLIALSLYCTAFTPLYAAAEDIKTQFLKDHKNLVVVELFSSQACAFCPRADALLADLIQNENVIGLACHVDYFDVAEGSLAQSFCTKRQRNYETALRAGPGYTPQMVINGAYDVVGYRKNAVSKTIKEIKNPPTQITITPMEKVNQFELSMPKLKLEGPAQIHIVFLDKPHEITIKDGANKGNDARYHNIANRMQKLIEWDGNAQLVQIEAALEPSDQGFMILAQESTNLKIIAAGQFTKTNVPQPKTGRSQPQHLRAR